MTGMKVGFIGLGRQGGPMAEAIQAAGHSLHVWARRPAQLAGYVQRGAVASSTAAELASAVDVLSLCVVSDDDVRDVLLRHGALASMRPGAILLIHSTVAPETVTELEQAARGRGIEVLDAPVSGGARSAKLGKLLVIVGGLRGALERVRPILESYAGQIVHVGPAGVAQQAKLVNNVLYAANLRLARSALALGDELGLERSALAAVLSHGSGRSQALESALNGVIDAAPAAAAVILRKDVRLARSLSPLPGGAAQLLFATADGLPDELDRQASSASDQLAVAAHGRRENEQSTGTGACSA